MTKTNELKKKSKEDLNRLLDEKVILLRNFRFGVAGSKAKNTKEGRNTRREIARIKTELRIKV